MGVESFDKERKRDQINKGDSSSRFCLLLFLLRVSSYDFFDILSFSAKFNLIIIHSHKAHIWKVKSTYSFIHLKFSFFYPDYIFKNS
jgi:hypothetical protein